MLLLEIPEMPMQGSDHLDLHTLLYWFTSVIIVCGVLLFMLLRFFIYEKYKAVNDNGKKLDEMYPWFQGRKEHDKSLKDDLHALDKQFAIFKAEQKLEREFYQGVVKHIRDNIDTKLAPINRLLMDNEDMLQRVSSKLDELKHKG